MKSVSLKEKELESLKDSNSLKDNAEKVDVSNNLLIDLDGMGALKETLKWLNASHNKISSVKHLKECDQLNVLNLSYNKITSLKHLKKLKGLKAIILNNNELATLDGIVGLKELNTLVVSNNLFTHLDLTSWPKLQKLSATNNKFEDVPNFAMLKDIGDVKLNHNSISTIPEWLGKCSRMKILDIGNNKLETFESIEALKHLPNLTNLNLKGNPLCDDPEYVIKVKELLPNLRTLDYTKMSDLYFKAIEEKAKNEKKSVNVKEKVIVNRGFKKKLTKEDTGIESQNAKENVSGEKENLSNKSEKELKKKKKKKKKKGEEEQKETTSDVVENNELLSEMTNGVSLSTLKDSDDVVTVETKAKKAKKHKLESESVSEEEENQTEPHSKKKKKNDSVGKKDKKKKTGEKKKSRKETGVVSIVKVQKEQKKKKKKKKKSGSGIDILQSVQEFGLGLENSW